MSWLDLVTPVAAVLALFGVVGLVVQQVRHGRALRRLEDRLAQAGLASEKSSLERLQQLHSRARLSQGLRVASPGGRSRAAILGVAAVVALAAVGGWWFFLRGGSGGAAGGGSSRSLVVAAADDSIPASLPPIGNHARYTVAVLNASGVTGAAARTLSQVQQAGYSPGVKGDASRQDLAHSVVMWTGSSTKAVAQTVAKDLGITHARQVDGAVLALVGSADAVVIVGKDLAKPA